MKLGLISDTHIARSDEDFPKDILSIFKDVELILHAGDIYVTSVLDKLEKIAPVKAAKGNGDLWIEPDPRIKDKYLLTLSGFRLGLTHGIDYPETPWMSLEQTMASEFGQPVDILVFGDTHVALIERFKNVLLINPGSPTLPRNIRRPGTVAILDISNGAVQARLIQL